MDAFILIFKGLQAYGFYNHFAVALVLDKMERPLVCAGGRSS